tara:strand:- start:4464 stop:4748 length:285 start_codon:yes stop_codon:yes gene_type:complete
MLITEIKYAVKIYLFWTVVHNLSIYLYNKLCVSNSFFEYIFTPLITITPHCKALYYVFSTSTDMMNTMMMGFSMWVIPKLTMFTMKKPIHEKIN